MVTKKSKKPSEIIERVLSDKNIRITLADDEAEIVGELKKNFPGMKVTILYHDAFLLGVRELIKRNGKK